MNVTRLERAIYTFYNGFAGRILKGLDAGATAGGRPWASLTLPVPDTHGPVLVMIFSPEAIPDLEKITSEALKDRVSDRDITGAGPLADRVPLATAKTLWLVNLELSGIDVRGWYTRQRKAGKCEPAEYMIRQAGL